MAPPRKPKVNRKSTMAVTAEAGKEIIGDETLGDTRQETKDLKKSPKPKMNRKSTMAVTAEVGKEILGKEELGDTRQETKDIKSAKRTTGRRPKPINDVAVAVTTSPKSKRSKAKKSVTPKTKKSPMMTKKSHKKKVIKKAVGKPKKAKN